MLRRGERTVKIAIDGPGASGKSAVGSRVAARLGVPFLDTGAMYRALTWLALRRGVAPDDAAGLAHLARTASVEVGPPPTGSREYATIRIAGEDATPHLRAPAVERAVSAVSAVPEVRAVMVDLQRRAASGDIVMAGRDIGTVVLPDADVKIYLDASDEVRARRRLAEVLARGDETSFEDVLAALRERDRLDSSRAVAPLRPAADAHIIHTDALDVDEVVAQVLALLHGAGVSAGAPTRPVPSPAPAPTRSDGAPARMTLGQRIFYRLMTGLMHVVVAVFGRYRVSGREHVPRTGPLIVVANHLNNADPPLVGAAVGRPIRFMAKQELFDLRPWGFFIGLFGALPVRRFEADLKALRAMQHALAAGEAVGMFPEGHRSHGEGLRRPYPGTALLALRTGALILPVGIQGTEAVRGISVLFKAPRIRVVIGEPFRLEQPERITATAVRAGADEIMHRIAALLPPRYRGMYRDG